LFQVIYPGREERGNSSAGLLKIRTAGEQSGYQAAALGITVGIALVAGGLTGFLLRLPIFEQLSKNVEMFDDEVQWSTPDDYALRLTVAPSAVAVASNNQENEKKNNAEV